MDELEWSLGSIAYLLAVTAVQLSSGGFILFDLSLVAVLIGLPIYLTGWPICSSLP